MPTAAHLLAGGEGSSAESSLAALLGRGADPNAAAEEDGLLTPLHVAAAWGRLPNLQLLLLHGADPACKDADGLRPVDLASQEGHQECVQALAEWTSGMQPYAVTPKKATATTTATATATTPSALEEDLVSDDPSFQQDPDRTRIFEQFLGGTEDRRRHKASRAMRALLDWSSCGCTQDPETEPPNEEAAESSGEMETALEFLPADLPPDTPTQPPKEDFKRPLKVPEKRTPKRVAPLPPMDSLERPTKEEDRHNKFDLDDTAISEIHIDEKLLGRLSKLSDTDLRSQLEAYGVQVGPFSTASRPLYVRRLAVVHGEDPMDEPRSTTSPTGAFSPELRAALGGRWDGISGSDEDALVRYFQSSEALGRRWREGLARTAFCYLLIDPAILALPDTPPSSDAEEAAPFRAFVDSVFYVGKGRSARPFAHLQDALEADAAGRSEVGEKLAKIQSIWASGRGVVSLHVFHNSLGVEAFSREAAMLDAFTLGRLSNKKRGEYYGLAAAWEPRRRRRFGVALLRKAFRILLLEGPTELHPQHVPPKTNYFRSPKSPKSPKSPA